MGDCLSDIQQREEQFLMGRDNELQAYRQFLSGQSGCKQSIWSVYGTGGMGKSTLLDAFKRLSYRQGACFVMLDSREFVHTPEDFCRSLLRQLGCRAEQSAMPRDAKDGVRRCLQHIRELAEQGPVTLALDTYEEMADMDGWLREHLFQWLPPRTLTVIAGRKPLGAGWAMSPAWRERVRPIALSGLTKEQAQAYLTQCGVTDVNEQEMIWEKTQGHPLALSLAAAPSWLQEAADASESDEWLPLLMEQWLREVPDQHLRDWIEVASVLRYFDRETISFVNEGQAIAPEVFHQLIGLSFVRKTVKGWTLHDVMREAACKLKMERTLNRYKKLLGRCASLYMNRILQAPRDGSAVWEVRECLYYIGDASIRWMIAPVNQERYVWEPLGDHNIHEGERYLQQRIKQALYAEEVHLQTLDIVRMHGFSIAEVLRFDSEAVKLLRNREEDIVGLSVIYSVNASTIPYLRRDPLASEYICCLAPETYAELVAPEASRQAYRFIRIIDVAEPLNPAMSIKALELILSLMVSDGLIVTSPPPDPIMQDAHRSMGFKEIEGVFHTYYDGVTPTPIFMLDTRGNKLQALFEGLLQQAGLLLDPEEEASFVRSPDADIANKVNELMMRLTEREQDVVKLVLEGLSNVDIGKALFVTEVTVKKHLRSVYQKLQVRNRAGLLRILI